MNEIETIREAARLMRERATAVCPSPWTVTGQSARYGGVVGQPTDGFREDDGYGGHLIGESMSEASRAHVVAWQPSVALAVAELLDTCAEYDPTDERHRYALAVARAYLGERVSA